MKVSSLREINKWSFSHPHPRWIKRQVQRRFFKSDQALTTQIYINYLQLLNFIVNSFFRFCNGVPISGKYCPLFTSNASVTVSYRRSDEEREIVASFSCNRGYRLTGRDSEVLSCDQDGRWEGRQPSCQRKAVSSSWNHSIQCLAERKYHTSSFLHWKTKQDKNRNINKKKETLLSHERSYHFVWTQIISPYLYHILVDCWVGVDTMGWYTCHTDIIYSYFILSASW